MPSFTAGLMAVLAAPLLAQLAAPAAGGAGEGGEIPAAPPSELASLSGNELVAQAGRTLLDGRPLEARVVQHVHIFGRELKGAEGRYLQLGGGADMSRLEIKISGETRAAREPEDKSAAGVSTLQQVSGRNFLYIRRVVAGEATLERVDLHKLREARKPAQGRGEEAAGWPAIGGLPALLDSLSKQFDFTAAEMKTLRDTPVWLVSGTRRQETSGPQSPTHVFLYLGADEQFPLFPYRIQFQRDGGAGEGPRPLLVLQFYGLRRRPDLTETDFDYRPPPSEFIIEATERYLAR